MDIVERLRRRAIMEPPPVRYMLIGASDEIEQLREALRKIARIDYRGPMPDGVQIAREALGEKSDEY